jgi:hypothetical protein
MLLGLVAMTQTGLLGQYAQTFLCTMGIYMILAASLNLVNGYMGEFSCGHAGFMAVGAYTASIVGVMLFVGDEHLGPALLHMRGGPLAFAIILGPGSRRLPWWVCWSPSRPSRRAATTWPSSLWPRATSSRARWRTSKLSADPEASWA